MDPLQFLQDYIFYTPEKKQQINKAFVESQKSNPAMPPVAPPINTKQEPRNFGLERTIREAEEDVRSGRIPSGAAGMMSGQSPTAAVVIPGLGPVTTPAPNTPSEVAIPRFADLRGSATPGSSTPAATNQGEAEAMASAETFRAGAGYPVDVDRPADYAGVTGVGTDTSSGNREALRNAPEDERMAAWAAANPELAKTAYAKGPKQSGYESIEKALGLGNNSIVNYDDSQTFQISDIPEGDRQDPSRDGLKDMQVLPADLKNAYDTVNYGQLPEDPTESMRNLGIDEPMMYEGAKEFLKTKMQPLLKP